LYCILCQKRRDRHTESEQNTNRDGETTEHNRGRTEHIETEERREHTNRHNTHTQTQREKNTTHNTTQHNTPKKEREGNRAPPHLAEAEADREADMTQPQSRSSSEGVSN